MSQNPERVRNSGGSGVRGMYVCCYELRSLLQGRKQ